MTKFIDPYYQGQSKVNYVLDQETGKIQKVPARGWEPEFEATQRAWDEINEELKLTLEDIAQGKCTPLAYHMKKRLMEPKLLAAETGICLLFVKRHLKSMRAWKNMSAAKKMKYAVALGIQVEELNEVPKGTP